MGLLSIKIKYDGHWPCLCSGRLEVWINDKYWDFGKHVLSSGGYITRDFDAKEGLWSIKKWPEGFPEKYKEVTLETINCEITHGCCGGCI